MISSPPIFFSPRWQASCARRHETAIYPSARRHKCSTICDRVACRPYRAASLRVLPTRCRLPQAAPLMTRCTSPSQSASTLASSPPTRSSLTRSTRCRSSPRTSPSSLTHDHDRPGQAERRPEEIEQRRTHALRDHQPRPRLDHVNARIRRERASGERRIDARERGSEQSEDHQSGQSEPCRAPHPQPEPEEKTAADLQRGGDGEPEVTHAESVA